MMGGGNVKLASALALWFSPAGTVKFLVLMSVAGGVLTSPFSAGTPQRARAGPEIPYEVAIFRGAAISANDILTKLSHLRQCSGRFGRGDLAMDVKKLVLIAGALVIAAISAIMANNMFAAPARSRLRSQTDPPGPKVLVANKALAPGTIIDADSSFSPGPRISSTAPITSRASRGRSQKMLGTVVRYPITAGQPVTRGALVGPRIAASSPRPSARGCAPSPFP